MLGCPEHTLVIKRLILAESADKAALGLIKIQNRLSSYHLTLHMTLAFPHAELRKYLTISTPSNQALIIFEEAEPTYLKKLN